MRVFLALLSLAATAFAYQVTSPNSQESWYSHGPVTVSWQRVDTDAEYFTMVLYNDVSTSANSFQTPSDYPSEFFRNTRRYKRSPPRSTASWGRQRSTRLVLFPSVKATKSTSFKTRVTSTTSSRNRQSSRSSLQSKFCEFVPVDGCEC